MKKMPKENYLRSLKPDPWLGSDRNFYEEELERIFPELDLSLLDDTALMNIYESGAEEMSATIGEYYEVARC